MDYFKEKVCRLSGEKWKQYNSLQKCQCSQCKEIAPQKAKTKAIKRVSDKKAFEDIVYKSERIKFLMLPENKICPITKQPATTVHHKKGRLGSLYLDKRYWVALSMEGHAFVEKYPEWAKENGYSLNRLTND